MAPSLQFHFCTSLHYSLSIHPHLRTLRTCNQLIGQPFGWVYSVRTVLLLPFAAESDPHQDLVHGVTLRHPPSAPKQASFRNTVSFFDTGGKYNNDTFPDLSALVLPSAPNVNSPPVWFAISVITSISLGFLFLVSVSLLSLYYKSNKVKTFIEKPLVVHLILFLGIISTFFGMFPPRLLVNYFILFAGITAFMLLRLWFANAGRTFNTFIRQQQGPNLKASLGNGFTRESDLDYLHYLR